MPVLSQVQRKLIIDYLILAYLILFKLFLKNI